MKHEIAQFQPHENHVPVLFDLSTVSAHYLINNMWQSNAHFFPLFASHTTVVKNTCTKLNFLCNGFLAIGKQLRNSFFQGYMLVSYTTRWTYRSMISFFFDTYTFNHDIIYTLKENPYTWKPKSARKPFLVFENTDFDSRRVFYNTFLPLSET
jgi:hypothetical protein